MVACIWHDKRDVNISSTNVSHTEVEVLRYDRALGGHYPVPYPVSLNVYNQFKAGVDRADQNRGYYSVLRKSRKYWRYLFYVVLDVAINNAFILYDQTIAVKPIRRYSLLEFRLDLADQLIAGFSSRKKWSAKRRASELVNRDNVASHRLVRFIGRKRVCVYKRRTDRGHAVVSRYGCELCQVNLCKTACFPVHIGAHV